MPSWTRPAAFPVSPAWALLLKDLSISAADVLRHAAVAEDLFARDHATLRADEFCRLMHAVDVVAGDPELAIKIGSALSFEMFDPPVFAAMCSENLNTALDRLSLYKRLCAPIGLAVTVGPEVTRLAVTFAEPELDPPALLYAMELAYCVRLARLGTRTQIVPRRVTCPQALRPAAAYRAYFGVDVEQAPEAAIEISAEDARTPFLTARSGMWSFFEPELRRRLAEIDAGASAAERARAALLELLPSGRASVQAVAARLGISTRTLQRRLQDEGASFQRVLDATRKELACHYLGSTRMAGAEISFLLGFEDPNSFVRAFNEWTGVTPEQMRSQLRARAS